MGNAHPSIAPYELFAAAGGELVLAVGNDRQFADLCVVLGAPELAEDARFVRNEDRVAHRNSLRDELEARLATAAPQEWVARLLAVGVPAGEVNDVAGAFALAERLGLAPVVELGREDRAGVRLPRNPIGLSRTPATYRDPPPRLS